MSKFSFYSNPILLHNTLGYINALLLLFICFGSSAQTYLISDEGTVYTSYGTFYDSGGSGGNYGNNEDYTITFCSDDGNAIVAAFRNVDIDWGDYLYIYDGPDDNSPLLAVLSRFYPPRPYTSSGTCLTFKFQSNVGGAKGGFTANISCTPIVPDYLISQQGNVTTCAGNFYDSGGQGNEHSDSEDYKITFSSADKNAVVVTFSMVAMGTGDTLYIYDGPDTSSPLLAKLSSFTLPGSYISSDTCLTFRFISDGGWTDAGFSAKISCAAIVSNYLISDQGTVSTCSANFYDSGKQGGEYANNEDYKITFCSSEGNALNVDLKNMDISMGDYLYLYDGPDTSSPLLETFSYLSSSRNYISSGTCLTFRFVSDNSETGNGFAARISCTPIVTGYLISDEESVNMCSGRLYDSGGQIGDYADNEDFTKTICSDDGQAIAVDFSDFTIESGDFLNIYDGPDTSGPLIYSVTDNSTPPPSIIASGTCLTFQFTSSSHETGTGFVSTFYCTFIPDVIDPNAICQDITINLDNTGNAKITASEVNGGSTDNFTAAPGLILTIDKSSFNCANLGDNTITLRVTDETGNSATCTSTVTVFDYNSTAYSTLSVDLGSDTTICEADIFSLIPSGDFKTITWQDGSTGIPYLASSAGLVSCTVSNGTSCTLSDEMLLTINSSPFVDLGNDTSICGFILLDAGIDGISYNWSTGETAQLIEVASGRQVISVDVENEYGCTDQDTINIDKCDVTKLFIGIPNTITPNSDGKNDTWIIDELNGFPDSVVEIYDRWGRLVYRSETGYPSPWDGDNMSGNLVPAGSYTYILMLNYENYERVSGSILVIN